MLDFLHAFIHAFLPALNRVTGIILWIVGVVLIILRGIGSKLVALAGLSVETFVCWNEI